MLRLTFSSKFDWDSCIMSIAKTISKKIEALIRSMKFLYTEVALYLYKFIICPCKEYCGYIWTGAPSCFSDFDKLQKGICRTVGPSLAASLEPLAHQRKVGSLSLFCRYYFVKCSSELAQLIPLLYSRGGSIVILIDCIIFMSPFLDVTRISMSTVYFLAQLGSGILCL